MFRYFLVVLLFSLTGCITASRYTALVQPEFQDAKANLDYKSDYLSFDLSKLDSLSPIVVSKNLKRQFIPAILYWQWNNTIKCEVSQRVVGRIYKENLIKTADSLMVFEKLKGQRLEIQIEEVPNSFFYSHKGHALILIIASVTSDVEAIFPLAQNFTINYKLIGKESTVKQGKISIVNKDKPVNNVWKSTKKFTYLYIDSFKTNNNRMSKEMWNKLLEEIQ